MTCTASECHATAGACATCQHDTSRLQTERDNWRYECRRLRKDFAVLAKAVQLTRKADDAVALCDKCQIAQQLGRLTCPDHRQLREDAEAAESEALVLLKASGNG